MYSASDGPLTTISDYPGRSDPTFYFDMRQQTLHDQPPRHSAEEVGLHIEQGEMTL